MTGHVLGIVTVVATVAVVVGAGIGLWWLLWAPLGRRR